MMEIKSFRRVFVGISLLLFVGCQTYNVGFRTPESIPKVHAHQAGELLKLSGELVRVKGIYGGRSNTTAIMIQPENGSLLFVPPTDYFDPLPRKGEEVTVRGYLRRHKDEFALEPWGFNPMD